MKSPMRMRREAAGLTQGEMGDLIGISGAQYSRYERAPETMTVIRLYYPLHPTDARAPGYILKAGNPEFPEIYVNGNGGVLAVAVERGLSLR